MKRVCTITLTVILLISPLVARNQQKIYPIDADEYQAITYLYLHSGYALPSTAGPWSEDELLAMLDKIDTANLGESALRLYEWVQESLNPVGDKVFTFGLDLALEGYYHLDTQNFTSEDDWIRSTNDRKPLVNLTLETWLAEHFYGFSEFTVTGRRYGGFSPNTGSYSYYYGIEPFTTNIFILYGKGIIDMDLGVPFRAFGVYGGKGWTFQIGRDRLSWGPGETGNFMLGEHLRHHDTARLALYSKNFKYTLATSFFAHPSQYYPLLKVDSSGEFTSQFEPNSQRKSFIGLNMFLGHRLEWRMFKNKVGFALSEAIMYQSARDDDGNVIDSIIDVRVLNPAMIFHDLYIRANANSLLTLELDYTPIKNVNLYGQIAIDEFALPGEGAPGVDKSAMPSAYGFMAGTKGTLPVGTGVFYGSLEWAKTDPYLYLRDNGITKSSNGAPLHKLGEYGINFIVAHREYGGPSISNGLVYREEYLGYKYGPDAIVMNGNVGYKHFSKWYLEGNLFYMLHGTHDKWTLWSHVYNEDNVRDDVDPPVQPPYLSTPTETHWTPNNRDLTAQKNRDAVSKTLAASLKGGYTIVKGLDVYGQVDYIHITNPGNLSQNAPVQDFQLSFGVSYSL